MNCLNPAKPCLYFRVVFHSIESVLRVENIHTNTSCACSNMWKFLIQSGCLIRLRSIYVYFCANTGKFMKKVKQNVLMPSPYPLQFSHRAGGRPVIVISNSMNHNVHQSLLFCWIRKSIPTYSYRNTCSQEGCRRLAI